MKKQSKRYGTRSKVNRSAVHSLGRRCTLQPSESLHPASSYPCPSSSSSTSNRGFRFGSAIHPDSEQDCSAQAAASMATTNGRPHTATGTPKEKTHTLRGSVSLADTTATATCGMLLSEPGSMGGTGGVRGAAPGTVTGSALGAKGAAPRPDRPPAGSVGLAALAREMQERGDANGGPDKARSAANGQQPEWRVKVRERKVKEKGRKVRPSVRPYLPLS